MYALVLLFSTFSLGLTLLSPVSDTKEIKNQLNDLSVQIERLALQINNSVNQLVNKIDNGNRDIKSLFVSLDTSRSGDSENTNQSSTRPVSALLIIDVQNDFINGSFALRTSPAKHNGEETVPVINQLIQSVDFDVVVYSHDWHPTDHISFFDNLPLRSRLLTNDSIPFEDLRISYTATFAINGLPRMEQTLWPRHCVQNTVGAQLHPDLIILGENSTQNTTVIHIQKGTKSDIDSYSAFWDNMKLSETKLNQKLKENNVTQVFVVGLATDWCVYSTAIHAIEYGYKTFIIEDACRGIDETSIKERLEDLRQKHGFVIQSNQVKNYTQG